MGILDTIKKKVKQVASSVGSAIKSGYTSVDKKVGGVLPGGAAPSSKAKAIGSSIKSGLSTAYNYAKRDIKGQTFTHEVSGERKTDSSGKPISDILQGTLPITPAGGGASLIKSSFKGILKKNTKFAELSKTRLMKQFGIKKGTAEGVVNKFNNMQIDDVLKQLTKKPKTLSFGQKFTIGTGVFGIGTTVAGADTMFTWYALDNIADGLNFLIRDVELGLERGTLTPEEADEMFSDADAAYDLAITKVNQTARYNPFTYAARTLIVKGADVKKQQYELNKANVLATLESGFKTEGDKIRQAGILRDYERGFITKEEYDKLMSQTSEEAISGLEGETEEPVADTEVRKYGGEESGGESTFDAEANEETFRERTLLFEAIRKRNAGMFLTPEEKALLEKYGISAQIESGGKSALDFGLLK